MGYIKWQMLTRHHFPSVLLMVPSMPILATKLGSRGAGEEAVYCTDHLVCWWQGQNLAAVDFQKDRKAFNEKVSHE